MSVIIHHEFLKTILAKYFVTQNKYISSYEQSARLHMRLSFLGPHGLPPAPGEFSTFRNRSYDIRY